MTTYGDSGVDDECPKTAGGGNSSGGGGGSTLEQQPASTKAEGGGVPTTIHHRPAEVRPPPALVGSWEDVIRALPSEHHLTATILWKLIGRTIRSEVHMRQLQRYAALGTVPRGLRIKVEPLSLHGSCGGGGVDEFVSAWRDHAERSSFELMRMLAAEHERQMLEARSQASVCYETLRRGLTRDQYALLAGVYNGGARSELQRLQQLVESKLSRDVEEYGRARAAPPRPPALPPAEACFAPGGGNCDGGVSGRACERRGGRSKASRGNDYCGGARCPPSPFLVTCCGGRQQRCVQQQEEMRERRRREPSVNSLIEEKRNEMRLRSSSSGGGGGCAFAAATATMTSALMGDARVTAPGVE